MANSEGVEDVFVLMSTLLHHFASLPMVERPHKQNGAEASIVLVWLAVCFAKLMEQIVHQLHTMQTQYAVVD